MFCAKSTRLFITIDFDHVIFYSFVVSHSQLLIMFATSDVQFETLILKLTNVSSLHYFVKYIKLRTLCFAFLPIMFPLYLIKYRHV